MFLSLCDDPAGSDRLSGAGTVAVDGPLAGWTFAVKDNIDVAGLPTTAACPSYAYVPDASARVVHRLEDAGATCIGKTNMDQFATGLVGTRTPHGPPPNAVDPTLVPGGSSSGSAVAVALGVVDVALGTDTAGSGRVPAAHNRIVGLKPTRGRLPTLGVVPAVRSLDCVSVFARTVADAWAAFEALDGPDAEDPWSRPTQPVPVVGPTLRVGVARAPDLDGELDRRAWDASMSRLAALDQVVVEEVDIGALVEVGNELYEGAWVAERHAAVGTFLETHPPDADRTVSAIVLGGAGHSAVDAHEARYRLAEARLVSHRMWQGIDVLAVPTTPGPATLAEVAADPVGRNSRLGTYTNWVNLLDQCAISVPGADRPDGLPFGVTLLGPAFADPTVARLAARLEGERPSAPLDRAASAGWLDLAVVGAHLGGQPLHHQLTDRSARFVASARTARQYRLLAMSTSPAKPALVHVGEGGHDVEVEVWRLPIAEVGEFLRGVPPPLALGTIELEDGRSVHGFVAEARAAEGAVDISDFGGWRAWLDAGAPGA